MRAYDATWFDHLKAWKSHRNTLRSRTPSWSFKAFFGTGEEPQTPPKDRAPSTPKVARVAFKLGASEIPSEVVRGRTP